MTEIIDNIELKKKFLGCLIGLAIGDALGSSREGQPMASEDEINLIINNLPQQVYYTDDTHMTIGVAESLIANKGLNGAHMARCFTDNYFAEPWRGYGPGPPQVFRLLKDGQAWDKAATHIYPGGSFGNGAAMRAAPLGLFFWNRHNELKEAVYKSSIITHAHIQGIEGATLQAIAVALAVAETSDRRLDMQSFISRLSGYVTQNIYRDKISGFSALLKHTDDRVQVVRQLGHGIEAFNSVPTAIFAFLAYPHDFTSTVIYAISLGGDTDTIASMAGAISGAYVGIDAIPNEWQKKLENQDYISELANELWQASTFGK